MTGTARRAAMTVAISGLIACAPSCALAYGIDGLFGGQPNPDGSVTVFVPIQTDLAPDRAVSVVDRARPDYDPLPLRLGSFLVTPSVEAGVAYNSNIYDAPASVSDEVISVHPAVTAVSDWNRHFLSVTSYGDLNFFQNHPDQNINAALFQVDGRYDLLQQTWISGSAGYQRQDVPRSTLDNGVGTQPTTFNLFNAGAGAYRGAGLIQTQANYNFRHFDYTNSPGDTPGYSAFNRNENTAGGKIAYDVSDDFKPYIKAEINSRDYDDNAARSSQGYRADVGVTWDLGGITSFDLYTGWLSQDYSSYGAQPLNQGVDYGGSLLWNVTSLTSVKVDVSRAVQESTLDGYNSFMATAAAATVTHELRRNILLEGDLSYSNDAYRGFSDRNDNVVTAGGGTRYLINRNLYADLDYSWNHRSSSVESQGYVDHLVVAKLGVRF